MTERDTDAVSDIDLIKRAQAEDLDAFCLLAERYARRIYLLASHYCRNPHDAEDLSQEVWLKAYQACANVSLRFVFLHVASPHHDQRFSESSSLELFPATRANNHRSNCCPSTRKNGHAFRSELDVSGKYL